MARDRSRVRETEAQIAAEIERQVKEQAELSLAMDKTAKDIQEAARSFAPLRTGKYAASIKVRKIPSATGLPARRVIATDSKAHWIEFGTGEPGPTRAFAPMEKAAHLYGGTIDSAGSATNANTNIDDAAPSEPGEYLGPQFVGGRGERTPEQKAAANSKLTELLAEIEDVE